MAFRLQQQYKKFRDFCQYFSISVNPISFQIDVNDYIPEIGVLNSLFALKYIESDYIIAGASVFYIFSIILLVCLSNSLEKQQKDQKSKKYDITIDLPTVHNNFQNEKTQDKQSEDKSIGVSKFLLTSLVILLLIVNSLFQQIIEGFVTNVIHEYTGSDQTSTDFLSNPKAIVSTLALFFGIYHVRILSRFVESQKPHERNIVDEQGRQKQYTEQTYQADIEKQNSPYKSLFKPYKSKYCHCELYTMILKALVGAITLIILQKNFDDQEPDQNRQIYSNIVTFLGLILSFIFIIKYNPYNYDGENKVALFCYISDILVLICTTAAIILDDSDILNIISWAIRIIFFLTPIIQYLIDDKYGPKLDYNMSTQEKSLLKKLEFTSLLQTGRPEVEEEMKNWIVFNEQVLDLKKYRQDLWHETWNIIFQYQTNLTFNQIDYDKLFDASNFKQIGNKYPNFNKELNLTPQERLVENRKIINTIGEITYEEELKKLDDTQFLQLRQNLLLDIQLEDCHDGNRFGTLNLNQFPFSAFFYQDISENEKEYKTIEDLQNLTELNTQNHKIQLLKMKRNSFRSMSGENLNYPAISHNSHRVSIGHGNTAQDYTYHSFIMHKKGQGHYSHSNFTINMTDGQGFNTKGSSQTGTTQIQTDIDHINYSMFSPSTHMLVFLNKNTIQNCLPQVYQRQKSQRKRKTDHFYERSETLSYHFNKNIIQNIYIDKQELKNLLQYEKNETLKTIQEDNWTNTHIENLYQNQKNPEIIYQHYFFRDLWLKNYDIQLIKSLEKSLNPIHLNFFGFKHFSDKENFEQQLEQDGLKSKSNGLCSRFKFMQGFFNNDILDNYYRMKTDLKKKHSESFGKNDPLEIIPQENYQNYLQDRQCKYQVLQIKPEENQQFLDTFQYNKPELYQSLLQTAKNFWKNAQNENKNQISSYQSKKSSTENQIRNLSQQISNLKNQLSQKKNQLNSAKSNLNGIPNDQEHINERNNAQSNVNSLQSDVDRIEREIRDKESDKRREEEILQNIIKLLQIIRNNQHRYDNISSMVQFLHIQNDLPYDQYVSYIAKNLYSALEQGSTRPQNYEQYSYSQLNIQY